MQKILKYIHQKGALGWLAFAALALLFVLTLLSPRYLPYNMDEFSGQDALGCHIHPLNLQFQHYDEGCHKYDLTPPFFKHSLPLRSYGYVGSIVVAPYYFIWKLIPSLISIRIQGYIYFVIMSLLIARIAKVRLFYALLGCLIFPLLFFNAIADTGISNLPLVLFLGSLLLIQHYPTLPPRQKLWAGFGVGLMIFLGLWAKLTFAWFFLPLFLFLLWSVQDNGGWKKLLKSMLPGIGIAAATLAIPTTWLFLSKNNQGIPLLSAKDSSGNQFSTDSASVSRVFHLIYPDLTDGSHFMSRILLLSHRWYDAIPLCLWIALAIIAILKPSTRRMALRASLCALILLITMLFFKGTAHPHHVMLAIPFMAIVAAQSLEYLNRKYRAALPIFILILAAYWASMGIRLPTASVSPNANKDKDQLLSYIRTSGLDSRTIQVHSTWGTYYIANMIGSPNEVVTFLYEAETRGPELQEIAGQAKSLHRDVLIITLNESWVTGSPIVQNTFGSPKATYRYGQWSALDYAVQ